MDCHRYRKRLGATRTDYVPEAATVVLCIFCMEKRETHSTLYPQCTAHWHNCF